MRYPGKSLSRVALIAAVAVSTAGTSSVAAQMGAIPGGWNASTDTSGDYHVGSDVSRRPGGSGMMSGYIRANVKGPTSSASLTQAISAEHFRGHRVRLTGFVRFSPDTGLALLFLRVEEKGRELANDYKGARVFVPARNSDDELGWVKYSIVVDIPDHSTGLRIGLINVGAYEAWLDDVRFELVGNTVSLTGSALGSPPNGSTEEVSGGLKRLASTDRKLAMAFVNLDFESPLLPARR
jgi:hypothetical protein